MSSLSATQLDKDNSFRKYRDEFFTEPNTVYLDGNSLGLLSKRAEKSSQRSLDDWKHLGIEGWTVGENPWFTLAEQLGDLMAPLAGAQVNEVICTGSTTVNLHQILATFYKPDTKRYKIVADSLAFPSDIYAIKSHLQLHNRNQETDLVTVSSADGYTLDEADIIAAFTPDVSVAVLPSVLYRSGQLLDIGRLARAARERGIFLVIDAAHSVGCVPHDFHNQGVDAAFWCTYKYLNGGPGSVGGIFVHEKHLGSYPGLAGWFSSKKDRQFEMSHDLVTAEGAGAMQIGTPHILSMATLLGSLEMFGEVGIQAVRQRSLALTEYLMQRVDTELADLGVSIVTPRQERQRGGHVALRHASGENLARALRSHKVIPDFRPPDIVRLAPIAFYTSATEIEKAIQTIKLVLQNKNGLPEFIGKELVT